MTITFPCPTCGGDIRSEIKNVKGQNTNCPSCNKTVEVPQDYKIGPGAVVGKGYLLEERISESSLGEIYLASQEGQEDRVRLEIISGAMTQDPEKVNRFLQEVELLSTLKHHNLLSAIEAGEDSGTYYLVTQNEQGRTLEEYVQEKGALDEEEAIRLLAPIIEALSYVWNTKKILHRDIKPQNIFITGSQEAKLTGFGIAKSSEAGQSLELTGFGFTIGTPEYMSPEQIRAESDLDFRTDMYSLGITFYEVVVGHLPFEEDSPMYLMQKHMDETPEAACKANENVSPACSAVIDKMLLKDRDERHENWGTLLEEMKQVLVDGKSRTPGVGGGAMKIVVPVVIVVIIIIIVIAVVMGKGWG